MVDSDHCSLIRLNNYRTNISNNFIWKVEGVARWTSRECDTRHGLLIGLLFAVSILPHTSAVYYYLTSWLPSLFINYTDCSKLICILYSSSCSCLLFVESYSNRVQQIGIPNFVAWNLRRMNRTVDPDDELSSHSFPSNGNKKERYLKKTHKFSTMRANLLNYRAGTKNRFLSGSTVTKGK